VSVLPDFTDAGLLPPGLHLASWNEVGVRFGGTAQRRWLLEGLLAAAQHLRAAGAVRLWLDGSFVTTKPEPADWDGAWDTSRVDLSLVDPVLLDRADILNGRLRQKAKYRGELFPMFDGDRGSSSLFFQETRDGDVKGIVLLDLGTLP
jgi:hypothetical protein